MENHKSSVSVMKSAWISIKNWIQQYTCAIFQCSIRFGALIDFRTEQWDLVTRKYKNARPVEDPLTLMKALSRGPNIAT